MKKICTTGIAMCCAALLMGPADGAQSSTFLREGAIICPFPSGVNDAVIALSRRDILWLRSTGCSQVSGSPEIIVLDGGDSYEWRVRIPRINQTAYVPQEHVMKNVNGKTITATAYAKYLRNMSLPTPKQDPAAFDKLMKHLSGEP
jgi:hypothetical protein